MKSRDRLTIFAVTMYARYSPPTLVDSTRIRVVERRVVNIKILKFPRLEMCEAA